MTGSGFGRRLSESLRAALLPAIRAALRPAARPARPGARRARRAPAAPGPTAPAPAAPAPGGPAPRATSAGVRDLPCSLADVRLGYAPRDDASPDPGEVVWAWVPFDEGDGRGKDRPVLVIGRRGADLVGLMLSSQDHDRDAEDEARFGRRWIDVGSGAWDPQRRPSEARLDRLLLVPPDAARRIGAALDRRRFDETVTAVRSLHRG
ncbi:type II toxin-antitoxin system PemK/MazF family toxin [Geodermatophilus sp. SYSU D00079]